MARSLLLTALSLGAAALPASSGSSNIKNIVVLVQENLSFDHFAGGLDYDSSIDGPQNPQFCNPANVSLPDSPQVCANPIAKNIASDDPNHSISGGNMQVFGTYHPVSGAQPDMSGFISEQRASYPKDDLARAAEAINYFTPDHIPVFNSLAQNYILFDRWFAAVQAQQTPTVLYRTSGTSHGHGRNDDDFLNSLPQKSRSSNSSQKTASHGRTTKLNTVQPGLLTRCPLLRLDCKERKGQHPPNRPILHRRQSRKPPPVHLDQPRMLQLHVHAPALPNQHG